MSTRHTTPEQLTAAAPAVDRLLVLVDFDGTLSPIVDDPDAARPAPGAVDALRALADVCPVALVSGRHLDDLRSRSGVDLPVTLAGGHGTEVARPDGRRDTLVDTGAVGAVLDDLEAGLADVVPDGAGWRIERKPHSIAVHYRQVAEPEPVLGAVRELLGGAADRPPGWQLLDGKMVTELRPAGVDKGGVVDALADEHPDRTVVVIGDDVTDEDAFRSAAARDGVTVLVASDDRDTAAAWRIDGPAEVVALLAGLAGRP